MILLEQEIDYIKDFFSDRPIKKAYFFGSYARGEADENSDILVELDRSKPIGMKFFLYQEELEQILKKKVDLVIYEGLSQYVRPFVDKDKVLIYERLINTNQWNVCFRTTPMYVFHVLFMSVNLVGKSNK